MRARTRLDVVAFSILVACTWGCSDSGSGTGSTISMGGSSSAGMAGASGSLTLGGSTPNGGSAGQTSQAGNQTGGGGTNGGGGSQNVAGMGQGGDPLQPESAGTVTVTVDGKPQVFDQCRITRQVVETDFSIDAKKKSGGLMSLNLLLSVTNGPGMYDCFQNHLIYYDDAGMAADATGSVGSCAFNVTQMSSAPGESLKLTFSAQLPKDATTVMLTDGTLDLKVKN